MMIETMSNPGASDYARIAHAIRFIQANADRQPPLEEIAAEVGLSEFHFQKLFQRWAGVSPKRFLQLITLARAKALLAESRPLLETSFEVGLSSAGRLHDLFVSIERMTPGEWAKRASGLELRWAIEDTPLGPALFAALPRGLCGLAFVDDEATALDELRARWPNAAPVHDPAAIAPYADAVRARMAGEPRPIGVVLKGTPLQLRVWEALLHIPEGRVTAYGELAQRVGAPGAARAVGSAVGANPLGYLIPCHRVIQSSGALGGYRWGLPRKLALLGREQARVSGALGPA